MKLKTILPIIALAIALVACNKPAGELVGAGQDGNFKEANPYGMVFIKKGSFMMGANTQSAVFEQSDNELMVTVEAFWMDETEITNDEYKQFVNWVLDSITLRLVVMNDEIEDVSAYTYDQEGIDEADLNREQALLKFNPKTAHALRAQYHRALRDNRSRGEMNEDDEYVYNALSQIFYSDGTLNTTKLHFRYSWMNYDQATRPENKYDVAKGCYPPNAVSRVDTAWIDSETGEIMFATIERPLREPQDLLTHKIISIYPDTMVWVRDFQYSYNDPLLLKYFSHRGFSDYPVVGVTWEQAHAFCRWRTDYLEGATHQGAQVYRLPTEAEWEYAARGGRKMSAYPWGGNYARDAQGCFLANFKPYRGAYNDDTGTATMKVAQFRPNDYGLFDMAGNVSEWTATTYTSTTNVYTHDLNPDFQYMARYDDPDVLKRKVIKGGSWKDISAYMQCGARTYEYQYEDRSYLGFRCVRSYIGD